VTTFSRIRQFEALDTEVKTVFMPKKSR